MADARQIERMLIQKYAGMLMERNGALYTMHLNGQGVWFIGPQSEEYAELIRKRKETVDNAADYRAEMCC